MLFTDTFVTLKKPTYARFLYGKFKIRFLLCFIFVATQPSRSFAEDESDSHVLSLSEAIQKTFDHNPDLQTFQYQIEAQRGRVIQAGLSPKPEVEFTVEDALGSGDFNGFDTAETTLSVSWILEQNIKEQRVNVASREMRVIESEKAIMQLDSATQTARHFLTALSYQDSAIIANRAIKQAETTVKEVNKRVEIGKTSLAELYRAEAALAKRKLVLDDINYKFESSIRQLAAQWGSTNPTFIRVAGTLSYQPNVISFHALKSKINNNPDLVKYLSQERIRQAELKLAEEERDPPWKFIAGLRHNAGSDDFGIAAGISLPFGGRNRNQGRIAEIRAKLSQNQSEADSLRIRIETSLFMIYRQLEYNIHLGNTLKQNIIPRLEKALTETHKACELGKYSYLEWQAVQNELLEAQLSLIDANLSTHLNKIEIERLTGAQITMYFN